MTSRHLSVMNDYQSCISHISSLKIYIFIYIKTRNSKENNINVTCWWLDSSAVNLQIKHFYLHITGLKNFIFTLFWFSISCKLLKIQVNKNMLNMKIHSISDLMILCAISESSSPKTPEFNKTFSDSSLLSYGLTTICFIW